MGNLIFLDFETTGLDYKKDRPTEIAFVKEDSKGNILEEYEQLIKLPKGEKVPEFIVNFTGITDELLKSKGKDLKEVTQEVQKLIGVEDIVIAHHASFDLSYLKEYFGIIPNNFICTKYMWSTFGFEGSNGLEKLYKKHIGEIEQDHRALTDVYMLRDIYHKGLEVGDKKAEEYINTLAIINGRELSYVPENAEVVM